ncbi:hypothetical protein JW921_07770 [Candidatus Fermentibacterales bacterium]|nr:hypothetical protein [Candidatus Fermentibacterales bacterium]
MKPRSGVDALLALTGLVIAFAAPAAVAQSGSDQWGARLFAGATLPSTRSAGDFGDRDYTAGLLMGAEMRRILAGPLSALAGATFCFTGVEEAEQPGGAPGEIYDTDFSSTMLNLYAGPRLCLGPVALSASAGYYSTRDRWKHFFPTGYSTEVYGDDLFGIQCSAGFLFGAFGQSLSIDGRFHWLDTDDQMIVLTLGFETGR